MGMIPFERRGEAPTIVNSSEHFSPSGMKVLIRNWDESFDDRIKTEGNASYDLRVGSQYRDHRDDLAIGLSENAEFKIRAGTAVIIQTLEEVQFPNNVFGLILAKVSILQKGLTNTATKIDPGFRGKLLITVFNLGRVDVSLKYGDKFCSLQLVQTTRPFVPYDRVNRTIELRGRRAAWRNGLDFLNANAGAMTALLVLATLMATVLSIIAILRTL